MYTTEKQAPGRLTRRRSGRRWLLIPALCAVLILAVVLIVELGKKPQVLPAETPATPISQEKPREPEPTPEPVPELLTLVNPWNQVPEDWSVDLMTLPNGLEIDKRCYDALMEMIDGCYDAGLTPVICSAYRTQDFQETLHNNKVSEWMDQGYGLEDAKAKAGRQVAVPGTSEHQLGLAVDIVDVSYQLLDTNQENTDVQKWLMDSSCGIPRTRRTLRASCMSRGITAMSARNTPRRSMRKACAWSSIWSSGASRVRGICN